MKKLLKSILPFSKEGYATPDKAPKNAPLRVSIKSLPRGLEFTARAISRHAVGITAHLQRNGHETYLVGGCVRDLLIGKEPKDFDIGTVAWPNTAKSLIRHSRIIGKRFRLIHVPREGQIFELATFRRSKSEKDEQRGRDFGENYYGTSEQDAWRRDFTVNALFYDPIAEELVDYVGGVRDMQKKIIRSIGHPDKRFKEDSIRILRAIRFSSLPGFKLESGLQESLIKNAPLMKDAVLPRVREELIKMMKYGQASENFSKCQQLKILKYINPALDQGWDFVKKKKHTTFAIRLLETLERKYDSPDALMVFGVQVYLMLLSWEKDKNKIRFFSYKDLKSNEKLFKICMERMLLSNKEREGIYAMIDIANRITDPANPVNKNEKRQKRLTRLKNFEQGLEFAELINAATGNTNGMFDEDLKSWRKLAKEKITEERALKRKRKPSRGPHDSRDNSESRDFKRSPRSKKTNRKKSISTN